MDNIELVQIMQEYIINHLQDIDFSAERMCADIGYSRRHADRIFKNYVGKTLHQYINAVFLTKSAEELVDTEKTILDIALDNNFNSHEGFTRSFKSRFSVTPYEYRSKKVPIPKFIQYPISHYNILLNNKECSMMSENLNLCMITTQQRPRRKLIFLPSKKATDYFSFCEEKGCEWEGFMNSIFEKFDTGALIELPDSLVEGGFSKIAVGVEVPLDFDKILPVEYKVAELCECIMLYFQTEPYENAEDFPKAIGSAYKALEKYNPELYGYKYAYDIAPSFNFGADPSMGARLAVPVIKIR